MKNLTKNQQLRALIESAILIALAFVLSYIRLFKMPQGGSVTAVSMLPLIILSIRRGALWGVLAGVVYGLLQFLQDGYVLTWANVLFDYLIAFGVIGLAGVFKRLNLTAAVILGTILASIFRFSFHFLSGVLFYGEYAPKGTPVWLYSLAYNGSFMLVEMLITAFAGYLIAKYAKTIFKTN